MAIPPPPYSEITGIYTTDDKHQAVSKNDYDGNAKPGQLVVDTTDYSLWIGNSEGILNAVTSGGGIYSNSNVVSLLAAFGSNSIATTGTIDGNGAGLTNLLPSNMAGMPSAQTLLVDPDGNNATADGSVNKPFQTIQTAHDYAVNNITASEYVAIRLNAGNYTENITLSRAKTAIVGATDGITRVSMITGSIAVNLLASSGTVPADIFALENVMVSSSSNPIVLAGSQPYVFFARNIFVSALGSANALTVTNTGAGGLRVDLTNVYLRCDGSGTALAPTNTYYLNLNLCTLESNTGSALNATTTSGFVTTTRVTTKTGSNVCVNVSQFAPGTALNFGVCTFESSATNGNGLYLTSGSTTTLGTCAFNIPAGAGFAVSGGAGSVLLKSANNNQIAYNTNGTTQGTVTVLSMSYL